VAGAAEPLPSHSLRSETAEEIQLSSSWPFEITREWAFGGSRGEGARVCILDSGVEADHPMVGGLERSVSVVESEQGGTRVADDEQGDVFGHGTACAGIIRSIAPACSMTSLRVLGPTNRGRGEIMLAGLRWAVEQGFDVINMSLSSTKRELAALLHELTDDAYFQRQAIVASAHNSAVTSYPWRFSSVISVGSHEMDEPLAFFYNPTPPVEFFARGAGLEVAWLGGGRIRSSGNSFATAHISAICALIMAKHPDLTPFELKSVLCLTADNVAEAPGRRADG
jgi:subtilisin family serine protease